MPINNTQKGLIHLYAHAAGMSEFEYRRLLLEKTGCASCADEYFDQHSFDVVMPALEVYLQGRIDRGEVSRDHLPRQIRSLSYWRTRAESDTRINRRQLDAIRRLWDDLQLVIGPKPDTYLLAIAARASNCRAPDLGRLSAAQAAHLIDALKDRLAHACRGVNHGQALALSGPIAAEPAPAADPHVG